MPNVDVIPGGWVTLMLKRIGFHVLAAADGAADVEIFRVHEREIARVVCDLTMPRMNGWRRRAPSTKFAPAGPSSSPADTRRRR